MASFTGAFVLAYLLSSSFTEEVQLNIAPVAKLVDYSYNMNFDSLIPGKLYNGSITASWAVPPSALSGIDGQSVIVKVTANASENSTLFFPTASGERAQGATVYLRCDVQNGTCSNTSTLSAAIPVLASALPDTSEPVKISLKSELEESSAGVLIAPESAEGLLDSFKSLFQGNSSENASENSSASAQLDIANYTGNITEAGGNILDNLKPEGDSKDPVEFLKENPLISLTALVIVIVITGAYLLNARD